MINFVLGLIIGGLMVWVVMRKGKALDSPIRSENDNAVINPEQVEKKRENLEKILELFKSNAEVTNDDAEKLLRVSNATAERYLNELEKKREIVQTGRTGRGVNYRLK